MGERENQFSNLKFHTSCERGRGQVLKVAIKDPTFLWQSNARLKLTCTINLDKSVNDLKFHRDKMVFAVSLTLHVYQKQVLRSFLPWN